MPVYRGIKLSIISQYGAQALPEYSPSRIFDHIKLAPAPDHLPALLDSTTQTATVYIPIFPRSLYWIRYHVYVPRSSPFFYFKAFINGVHIVSWGVGEADAYGGKVMFGLYDNGRGSGMPSRQLLAFSDDTSLDYHASIPPGEESLEVRVYRSNARRPIPGFVPPPVIQGSLQSKNADGSRFRNAFGFKAGGEVDPSHPITQYEYALSDPVDTPYATFRWLPRTWHELDQLDVVSLDSEPRTPPNTRDLPVRNNAKDVDPEDETKGAHAQAEQHGTAPFREAGEDSPLRVPVYQVSCSTIEPQKSPTRGTVSERLALTDGVPSSNVGSALKDESKKPPVMKIPRRSRVLEPYNTFDRVATAQPANRATLLNSVVTQLRSRRPGSPHSKKALQQYLERRHSERSSDSSTKDSDTSNITHVHRDRADSYQATIESASGQEYEGNLSYRFHKSIEALSCGAEKQTQSLGNDGASSRKDTTAVDESDAAQTDTPRTGSDVHRSFVLKPEIPTLESEIDEDTPSASESMAEEGSGLMEATDALEPMSSSHAVSACYQDQSKSVERPPYLDMPDCQKAMSATKQKWLGARLLDRLPKGSLRQNRWFGL